MPEMEIEPSEVKRRLDAGEKMRLVDVREPFEHRQANIAHAELIPMRTVPQVGRVAAGCRRTADCLLPTMACAACR